MNECWEKLQKYMCMSNVLVFFFKPERTSWSLTVTTAGYSYLQHLGLFDVHNKFWIVVHKYCTNWFAYAKSEMYTQKRIFDDIIICSINSCTVLWPWGKVPPSCPAKCRKRGSVVLVFGASYTSRCSWKIRGGHHFCKLMDWVSWTILKMNIALLILSVTKG